MPVPPGPVRVECRYGLILKQIARGGPAPDCALGSLPIANRQAEVHCAIGKVDFPVADFAGFG